MLQNGALRALALGAILWASASAGAAQAEPRTPAAPTAQPRLTPAILRDEDLGPTVPQMTSRLWSELHRTRSETIRAAREPCARAI